MVGYDTKVTGILSFKSSSWSPAVMINSSIQAEFLQTWNGSSKNFRTRNSDVNASNSSFIVTNSSNGGQVDLVYVMIELERVRDINHNINSHCDCNFPYNDRQLWPDIVLFIVRVKRRDRTC